MTFSLKEADKVEILTLQDNYIDALAQDSNEVVTRAMPLKGLEFSASILAEHGFSALVRVTSGGTARSMLFDFGFSDHGAAWNAQALGADLSDVEVLVLSHGHRDHIGGLEKLAAMVNRDGIDLVVHPEAFRTPRYKKVTEEIKITIPSLSDEKAKAARVNVRTSDGPMPLLGGTALFLGGVPRRTDFEKGAPGFFHLKDGEETVDDFADDTAVVFQVKGKGLVVLTGCAHSGVVNTVLQAREVTGVDKVHAVMGGFHLSGREFADIVEPTSRSLMDLNPDYVIPTHCTGRDSIMKIERAMPEKFLLNMAGTRMTFAA